MYLITRFYNDSPYTRFLGKADRKGGTLWTPYLRDAKKFLKLKGALHYFEIIAFLPRDKHELVITRLMLLRSLLLFGLDLMKINGSKRDNTELFDCVCKPQSLLIQNNIVNLDWFYGKMKSKRSE